MDINLRRYGLLAIGAVLVIGSMARAETAPRPNIIVIFMDDLGYNDIGIQTYPDPPNQYPVSGPTPNPGGTSVNLPEPNVAYGMTPSIDSLAENGMRLTQFYASRACSQARSSLLTGRYDSRTGVRNVFYPTHSTGLNTTEVTLPELLRQEGYATAMVGKWHLGYNPNKHNPYQMMPVRHGFHEFLGFPHSNDMDELHLIRNETIEEANFDSASEQAQITWRYTEDALDFIQRSTAVDKPFFLYFAHSMTHRPTWPSDQEYTNADGTLWPKFQGTSGVSYYYDVVKEADHSVGRILDQLAELGVADNTLIIFTSDNGPWTRVSSMNLTDVSVGSAYPLRDGKTTTWEGGCRVPFLVQWPGHISAGTVSGELTGLVDLLPTFVGLAGGSVPSDRTIDGIDLTGLWTAENGWTSPRSSYGLFGTSGGVDSVLRGDWKLRSGALYNLVNDIQETTDVSGSEAVALADLQAEASSIDSSISADRNSNGTFTSYEVVLSTNDLSVPEGSTAGFDVSLSANPGKTVVVSVTRFSGDASLSVSSGANRTFSTGNWNVAQTVTLSAAQDVDANHSGATFRVTTDDIAAVRNLFAFEVDDEAAPDVQAELVWPKAVEIAITNSTVKLVAEGAVLLGGTNNPAGTVYGWQKVSGPGEVDFANASTNETGVSFSTNGTYWIRFRADHPSARAFGAADFSIQVGAKAGEITVETSYKYSPTLVYDATADTDGDAAWENQLSPGTRDWSLAASVTRTTSDPAAQLAFIDAAYTFSGGAIPSGATSKDFDAYSTGDASFEFWFKPASLPVSSPQVLWESGGNVGSGILIEGSLLRFAVDGVSSGAVAEGTLSPSSAQDGFVHCVGVIDLGNDEIRLYLDGSLADTKAIATVSDWCGTSQTGLGTISHSDGSETTDFEHIGGNDLLSGTYGTFAGQIAWVSFYDKALSVAEVADLALGSVVVTTTNSTSYAGNMGPVVSVGTDQSVAYTNGAALSGSASDDGGSVTTLWRLFDGPANPTFDDAAALATSASFSLPGAHTLWLEADDGDVKVYDEVVITVASLTYDEWASDYTFPAGEGDPEDNPDGDGWANLWEWLFGSNPLISDSTQPYTQEVQSSSNQTVAITIQLTVPRNRQPDIALEATESLLSGWSTLSDVVPTVEILDATTERWTFNLLVDSDAIPQYFVRSRLSQQVAPP